MKGKAKLFSEQNKSSAALSRLVQHYNESSVRIAWLKLLLRVELSHSLRACEKEEKLRLAMGEMMLKRRGVQKLVAFARERRRLSPLLLKFAPIHRKAQLKLNLNKWLGRTAEQSQLRKASKAIESKTKKRNLCEMFVEWKETRRWRKRLEQQFHQAKAASDRSWTKRLFGIWRFDFVGRVVCFGPDSSVWLESKRVCSRRLLYLGGMRCFPELPTCCLVGEHILV